jgi:putative ABC transport system permease protein
MAVGASRGAVLWLVAGEAAKLVGIGIGIGLLASAIIARWIASLLFGVAPFDTATVACVSVLLAIVGFGASYVPARRAAKADPMDSLRYE